MISVQSEQELRELLQCHGINITLQRLHIAGVLFSSPRHISADQLFGELQLSKQIYGCEPRQISARQISKATVYNTLGLFSRAGLVREIIVDRGRVIYDSNTTPHHHIYNTRTATLSDISDSDINVWVASDLPGGIKVEAVDVIIRAK